MTVLVIIVVGLAVGLLSGLVGIGGGVLIVPFLYFFYDHPDLFQVVVAPEARAVLAHGTSLLVIVPTSIRGALAYHRVWLVEWRAVWPIGAASVFAALAGTRLAVILPPEVLRTGFGMLLVASGARMLINRKESVETESAPPAAPNLSLSRTIPTGLLTGLLSALLGVGGGTVTIPLLLYWVKLDIRKVAATSIGVIAITATAGTLGYILSGIGDPGLPRYTLGYVDLSAGTIMFLAAAVSVRWGTRLNQRMNPRTLTMLFGALFILLGLELAAGNVIAFLRGTGSSTSSAAPVLPLGTDTPAVGSLRGSFEFVAEGATPFLHPVISTDGGTCLPVPSAQG